MHQKDVIVRIFEMFPPFFRNRFPYQKPWFIEFCKFVIVGVTSSLIMLAILYSLTEFFGVYYLYSAAIGLFISAINGYTWNHAWTFKTEGVRKHHFAFSKYITLNTATYLLNLSILAFLVENFGLWYILSEIIALFIAMVANFVGSRHWAFKSG